MDETDRLRFVSEARLLAGLDHPHLVRVLDAGIDHEQPFLALELVTGPTLVEALVEGLPAPRLAELGAEVCEALAHVHAAGIVHRDVKPGNVLLTEDGSAKLADFGIARLVDDTLHHTRTGMLVGTIAYLAPEQVAAEPATTAIDVYAFGLVLLEGLTGHRSFVGTSVESALARLARQPDVPDQLPAGWAPLLREMTAREPSARPTAAQAAARLRALSAGYDATLVGDGRRGADAAKPAGGLSARLVLAGVGAGFALLLGVAAWPLLGGPADSAPAHRLTAPTLAQPPVEQSAAAIVPAATSPSGTAGRHRAAPQHAKHPARAQHAPKHGGPKHHGKKHGGPKQHR